MESTRQERRNFVQKLGQAIGFVGVGFAPSVLAKKAKGRAKITSVSLKQSANGQQRLIFKLDQSFKHKVSIYTNPERVVIDFFDTQVNRKLVLGRNSQQRLIKHLRQATRNTSDYRVVLDMASKTTATAQYRQVGSSYLLDVALGAKSRAKPDSPEQVVKRAINAVGRRASGRQTIIAIDAGHGGRDPGAVGKRGTQEKHIALQIAKRLKRRIDRQPGMTAILIRDDDYYVSLRKRIAKARANKANLFISIHADANPNRSLTGSSVYILSAKGASSETARWLANNENSYEERMAGTHLIRKNKVLSTVLLDLSMTDTIDKSHEYASGVLKELGRVNRLLRHRVESAGFVVLKSPDIPSLLVETAFISNPMEEKRLKTSRYQEQISKAIFNGVYKYQLSETFVPEISRIKNA